MYSEVLVLYPVPQKKLRGKIFQSKDLPEDFLGGTYTITEDGRLLFRPNAYESVPERERPFYGAPEWKNPLHRAIGCLKATPGRRRPTRFTGTVDIYTDRGDGVLATFRATFVDGKLARLLSARRKAMAP
jgi:hypothetical protein